MKDLRALYDTPQKRRLLEADAQVLREMAAYGASIQLSAKNSPEARAAHRETLRAAVAHRNSLLAGEVNGGHVQSIVRVNW